MASPFKVFRKHQKVLIATLGVMAMIAFVFLPIVMQSMNQGPAADPVVVETDDYGKLHKSDLDRLVERRWRVIRFLNDLVARFEGPEQEATWEANRLLREAMRSGPANQGDGDRSPAKLQERAAALFQQADQWRQMGEPARTLRAYIGPASEEAVVDTWLCARRAEQLGMVVNDKVINDRLRELTANRLKPVEITAIIKNTTDMSPQQFFAVLRHELLAVELKKSFALSLQGSTPAQRWEYDQRLNRQATVELIPVAVKGHVHRIEDPEEAVLEEFFEKHKLKYKRPGSPEPGFCRPRKVAVRYVQVDAKTFEKAAEAVTEEEIQAEFEKRKHILDWDPNEPLLPPEPEKEPEEGKETKEPDQPENQPAGETDQTPKKPDGEPDKTSPQQTPAEETGPAEEPPVETPKDPAEKLPEKKPAGEPEGPTDDTPAEKQDNTDTTVPQPDDPGDTSSARRSSPFRLASMRQVNEEDTATGDAESQEVAPFDFQAFQRRVQSQRIRAALRNELAANKLFGRLEQALKKHKDELEQGVADLAEPAAGELIPPPKADLVQLAEESNLSLQTTPLMSQYDVSAYVDRHGLIRSVVGGTFDARRVPFVEMAVGKDSRLALFDAKRSQDDQGNHYLFWAVQQTKHRPSEPEEGADPSLWEGEPKFQDPGMREEVLLAWKMERARELAVQEAEQLAEKARQAEKSLRATFADQPEIPVVSAGPFTWMTYENVPQQDRSSTPPSYSKVPGVEWAGREFMQTVFGMNPGNVAVAMNHPQTIAYVIRVESFQYLGVAPAGGERTVVPRRTAWENFLVEYRVNYEQVGSYDKRELMNAWLEDLKKTVGFQWLREPAPEQ